MSASDQAPSDQEARNQALNPLGSYCVSAPAGSGKTGLLVQRFLTLLTRCDEPEHVVAITFTRKAAAEMRARILEALSRAEPQGGQSENPHEERLLEIARKVLAKDQERGWGLLAMPSRLSIRTIDSLCAELSRQMPILSGAGGPVSTTDQAQALYREAVDNFLRRQLASGDGVATDLQDLLLHLDNRWDLATDLLASLLGRREQWQPMLGAQALRNPERSELQSAVESLLRHRLGQIRRSLGSCLPSLTDLAAYREKTLERGFVFNPDSDSVAVWREASDLLLTKGGEWRKTVNKRDGFPAGKGSAGEQRAAMISMLQELQANDDGSLHRALKQLKVLPDPDGDAQHWHILSALTRLLPRLAAELLLVFQQRGEVDHGQVALAALQALGDDDRPTDIALRLDYRIEHLLVDEFQDTSSIQFELVRRLTRGWNDFNRMNPQAPRTLLVVGDAMQSIYGFREANVGLFIRARDEGVGDLPLVPLDLTVNFRSGSGLVSWTNEQFQHAFPAQDDTQLGAVHFRPADAYRQGADSADLRVFAGEGAQEAELVALCDRVSEGLRNDAVQSMAILGRSRNHLRPVIHALRERDLPFAGQDLDPLANRPLIRDLLTLCTVLRDRFDRLAWLSLLRCPVAALDNHDLLAVARHIPIPWALPEADLPALEISPTGLERLAHVSKVLRWAEHFRDRLALRVWVEECWLRLGGAATLKNPGDVDDAEAFFRLLEKLDQQGFGLDSSTLESGLEKLYAAPGEESSKLQIMTLHKAKGLEFDEVFIPALGRGTASQDRELLLWDEVALPGRAPGFLMDIRAGAEVPPSPQLYDFLHDQAKEKRRLESVRLFYVGCTRAADYLWLSAALAWEESKEMAKSPQSQSLMAGLWPQLEQHVEVTRCDLDGDEETEPTLTYRRLARLPEIEATSSPGVARTGIPPDSRLARSLGTATHRCLESLLYRTELPQAVDADLRKLLRISLLASGSDQYALDAQLERGEAALNRVLGDQWARWMLSPQRPERFAELPLTLVDETGEVLNLILDYVFVDEARGERWVVDYKTAQPRDGEPVEHFMDAQIEHYRVQLNNYRGALEGRFREPVRCALYFTALGQHRAL